ncbi:hypothetical protein HY546_03455, partial [archaeon]|nr:hypothetical protein [archaeon]
AYTTGNASTTISVPESQFFLKDAYGRVYSHYGATATGRVSVGSNCSVGTPPPQGNMDNVSVTFAGEGSGGLMLINNFSGTNRLGNLTGGGDSTAMCRLNRSATGIGASVVVLVLTYTYSETASTTQANTVAWFMNQSANGNSNQVSFDFTPPSYPETGVTFKDFWMWVFSADADTASPSAIGADTNDSNDGYVNHSFFNTGENVGTQAVYDSNASALGLLNYLIRSDTTASFSSYLKTTYTYTAPQPSQVEIGDFRVYRSKATTLHSGTLVCSNSTTYGSGASVTLDCGNLSQSKDYRTEILLCNENSNSTARNTTASLVQHRSLSSVWVSAMGNCYNADYDSGSFNQITSVCDFGTTLGSAVSVAANGVSLSGAQASRNSNACEWFAYFTTTAAGSSASLTSDVLYKNNFWGNNTTTGSVYLNIPTASVSFTASYPSSGCSNSKGCETGGCSACTRCYIETSSATATNVSCEGQTASVPFFIFQNTGNIPLNLTYKVNESLSSGRTLKASRVQNGWESTCTGNEPPTSGCLTVTTSEKTIAVDVANSASINLWLWGDFSSASSGTDTRTGTATSGSS